MSELNRSPLADPGWHYLEKIALEDLSRDDWGLLEGQRQVYLARHQAEQALRLLTASEHDPCFGYQVNNYRHSLQSATMVLRDGLSEEDVVVALLHDVGFIAWRLCGDPAGRLRVRPQPLDAASSRHLSEPALAQYAGCEPA